MMVNCWVVYTCILICARISGAAPRSCDNCQCAEDPCPPWWVDRDDRILFDYNHGQVSVSSSAAASVKYPPPGSGGSPQAYISSLSSAKADPKIPVTVNDGAAGIPVALHIDDHHDHHTDDHHDHIIVAAPPPSPPAPPPPPPPPAPAQPPPACTDYHHDCSVSYPPAHIDDHNDHVIVAVPQPPAPPPPVPIPLIPQPPVWHVGPYWHYHPNVIAVPIPLPTLPSTAPSTAPTTPMTTQTKPKSEWDYKSTPTAYGPDNWHKIAPQCAGPNQSPIDIVTANAVSQPLSSFLQVNVDGDAGGEALLTGKLVNNGKTIGFNVASGSSLTIRLQGQVLRGDTYVLKQFHLHFGCGNGKGSEHTLDGKPFGGELHLVFVNEKYPNPKVAMQQKDGLVIIAFFLQGRPDAPPNPVFHRIAETTQNIKQKNQQINMVGGLSLKGLVPHIRERLGSIRRYVYKGSLPTPPCYESVTWIIFNRPITIPTATIKQYRALNAQDGQSMCGNNRPVQPLNGRDVLWFNIKPTTAPTTAAPSTTALAPPTTAPALSTTAPAPSTTAAVGSSTVAPTGGGSSTATHSGSAAPTTAPPGRRKKNHNNLFF